MKHPFAVRVAKVTDYLLNPAHPVGGPKAKFFGRYGFSAARPGELADALLSHSRVTPSQVIPNEWGTRYVVEGPVQAPDGRLMPVRTVWQTPNPEEPFAVLSTAVPLGPKV